MTGFGWRAGVTVTAVVLGLGGCSSGAHQRSPSPTAAPTRSEAQLRQQAEAKLTGSTRVKLRWTGLVKGPTVTPRTTVGLADSKPYVVEAACAGTGSLDLSWTTRTAHRGSPQVHCGGPALRYAFTGGDLLSFSFETYHAAAGVLTWQVVPADREGSPSPAP
jgi:hypothetical protein